MRYNRNFFGRVFDLSFSEFITPAVMSGLYAVAMVVAGITALFFIGSGFAVGKPLGFFYLIVAPLVFLAYVILARMWFEFVIVVFRIAENTGGLGRRIYVPADQRVAPEDPGFDEQRLRKCREEARGKSDSELMATLANRADYVPEAVEAALQESKERARRQGLGGRGAVEKEDGGDV